MNLRTPFVAMAAALALATPSFADILISDGYARSSGPSAKSGGAFLRIENTGPDDDQLLSVTSDAAKLAQLHDNVENDQGVMSMVHLADGVTIPANAVVMFQRGGKHIMFMGLTAPFIEGNDVTFTLVFRDAGDIEVTVPVDLSR